MKDDLGIKNFIDGLWDHSAKWLLASNTFTLLIGMIMDMEVHSLMAIYWCQSVIIGWYNFRRMRLLKQFDPGGLRMNNKLVPPTEEGRNKTANFFAFHYGLFHLGYLLFLISRLDGLDHWDYAGIAAAAISFNINHAASHAENVEKDLNRKPNLAGLMFFPYLRVVPMHLAIGLASEVGGRSGWTLAIFIGLKTIADMIMHAMLRLLNSAANSEQAAK